MITNPTLPTDAARRQVHELAVGTALQHRLVEQRVRAANIESMASSEPASLGRAAKGFRVAHELIAVIDLVGLGYLWTCALSRRRDRLLRLSIAALLVEGVALIVGRGNCPLGPLQRRLGDPVPLFELVLPPRGAKAAVPMLAAVSAGGLALLAIRRPSDSSRLMMRAACVRDRLVGARPSVARLAWRRSMS